MDLINFFIIFLIGLIISIFCTKKKSKINFLSKDDLRFLILLDQDKYIENFNDLDKIVRKCKSNCKKIYVKNLTEFTENQKNIITYCIKIIDKQYKDTFYKELKYIPWNIACTNQNIDNGFPHTRGNIILISDKYIPDIKLNQLDEQNFLNITRVLLHEKIHIFQRLFPKKTLNFYNEIGFQEIPNFKLSQKFQNIRRSNPDLDNKFYKINIDNIDVIPIEIYKNNPQNLLDSNLEFLDINYNKIDINPNKLQQIFPLSSQLEHPSEIMATMLSNKFNPKRI